MIHNDNVNFRQILTKLGPKQYEIRPQIAKNNDDTFSISIFWRDVDQLLRAERCNNCNCTLHLQGAGARAPCSKNAAQWISTCKNLCQHSRKGATRCQNLTRSCEICLPPWSAAKGPRAPRAWRRWRPRRWGSSAGWQNFGKMLLVFGCIGTDFCEKIRVLQHFSKSTGLSTSVAEIFESLQILQHNDLQIF